MMRIGWIGCGTHARQMLLPQLVRQEVQLAALCDLNTDNLASAGRQFGVTVLETDYRELLARTDIDAIGMAIGPAAHLEIGLAALERGLPVFMEKPPGACVCDAEQLEAASDRAGLPLVVGFMKRYSIGNRIAQNIISGSDFGPVLGLYGSYMTAPGYFVGNADYTGFFLHHCIHYMDLPSFLAGPVRKVHARQTENGNGHLLMHISLDFESGGLGTIVMGTIQSRGTPMEYLQIMGDHKRIVVDNVLDVTYYRDPPFKVHDTKATLDPSSDALTWSPNLTAAANEDFKGYETLMAETIRAFKGEASNAPTIADGVNAMRLLEEVRRQLGR